MFFHSLSCRLLGAAILALQWLINSGVCAAQTPLENSLREFVGTYCIECHNREAKSGELDIEALASVTDGRASDQWEKIAHRLRVRQMPPADAVKPDEATYRDITEKIERELDSIAARSPQPGTTSSLRRLTRTEYRNSIRDLLGVDPDVLELLPADESSHGFDNVTVGDLSPTLLNRYLSAAQKISRIAVGSVGESPEVHTFRVRPDLTQEEHIEGLPYGTRGGTVIDYAFPQDGDYEIQVRLTRDRNEEVEGLRRRHQLEILLDREKAASFEIKPPPGRQDFSQVDAHLKAIVTVKAGRRQVGVTFVKQASSLLETKRQPLNSHFNMHRHPRISPAVYQVTITGPRNAAGPGTTLSREKLFGNGFPSSAEDEAHCATRILNRIMQKAYRRPVDEDDLKSPMKFFYESRSAGFEAGIEAALTAVLVNPNFLFRIETAPDNLASGATYQVSDLELASRLSYFLWSSLPDEELMGLAIRNELHRPEILEQQTRRLMNDPRSATLASNFADQWLYLRNLESFTPDLRLYPDFDENLRRAFRRETELLFETIHREDRSVMEFLKSDYTYLNERLAKHYGIPHIYGSHFRRVTLSPETHRGGLLRHGSVLTVTSYATRTSPVLRGHWILKNIVGAPPGPPPANVPSLKDVTVSASLSVRNRLAEHRANAACASCHNLMDPPGLALENFDAVGRWRDLENDEPIDASGELSDGTKFRDVDGLEAGLLQRPELFARTMAEKLLTYGLGRGIESSDGPALRQIVREAEAIEFRFSSLILGIVKSPPFQMRTVP